MLGKRAGSLHTSPHILQPRQLPVNAPAPHELLVRATLDNFALVKHVNDVGALDRGEAVRDGDSGAALCGLVERGLDDALRGGVEGRRGFVEEAKGRVLVCW